mgnify:CR=1 FL=1|tara:strand:- start:161 stop:994 length:834 start_codon:yes stop_codon:yes gene_type:complete
MHDISFTLDLEDHQPKEIKESNYSAITKELLSSLKDRGICATVFILGRLAYADPELIDYIADNGHEIAYHSYQHTPLINQTASEFVSETEEFKEFIHARCGIEVKGYRAPVFSLTSKTTWVVDCLKNLGFCYSSSVLPAGSPLYGFPSAPKKPFRWNNGVIELPAPIHKLGPVSIPFLGGIYFRYLPLSLIKIFLRSMKGDHSPWIYCHPHDFDYKQPYFKIPGNSHIVSLLLWFNRKDTNRKLFELIDSGEFKIEKRSFIQQIEAGKFDSLPEYAY